MAKIVKLFLIFLFVLSLNAADFDKTFSNFDKNFITSNLATKKKFHNELKDIYLKTSTNKNRADRIGVLERLVHSSKNLGYNHKGYENELNSLGGSYTKYLNSIVKTTKVRAEEVKLLEQIPTKLEPTTAKIEVKKVEQKSIKQELETKPKSQEETKSTNKEKEPQSKLADKSKKLKLLSAETTDDGIRLKFNRAFDEDERKVFALKSDMYRNIIDFKAENSAKVGKFESHIADEIRIAQFDTATTRVVFSQKSKFEIKLIADDEIVDIVILGGTNLATKSSAKTSTTSTKSTEAKKSTQPAKTKIIVIDPGHGGKDPGAMANKLKEKEIVLNISKRLGVILKERGYKVYNTRSSDKFINLKNRTSYANKQSADMFVSIHINAGPNTKNGKNLEGVETFFLSPARSERSKNAAALENKGNIEDMNYFSQQIFLNFLNREKIIASNKLAIDIQKHMLNKIQDRYEVKDGGVREAPFWVLVGAGMPAILVECGYITNAHDSQNLAKKAYQNEIAEGIANGIDAYFAKNK